MPIAPIIRALMDSKKADSGKVYRGFQHRKHWASEKTPEGMKKEFFLAALLLVTASSFLFLGYYLIMLLYIEEHFSK